MPVYEYFCSNCRTKFDALRPMSEADVAIKCENCDSPRTGRVLSMFFAQTGGSSGPSEFGGGGGGCGCGGACSCGHSHN
jgi:putative FmdB family regulatory protein